jgi:glutamate dehydrogenase (NADP+)
VTDTVTRWENFRAAAERCGAPGNYLVGANIAGFIKVVDAMLDQGLV